METLFTAKGVQLARGRRPAGIRWTVTGAYTDAAAADLNVLAARKAAGSPLFSVFSAETVARFAGRPGAVGVVFDCLRS